jgi:hypothetical protein
MMNKILLALGVLLLVGATASAQYYAPEVVTTYYPAPVYTAPVPYAVPAPMVYSAYYAPPVVVARPRVAYMPVAPAFVAPPVVAVPPPVVLGSPAVIRSKVYYPGHPIRNTVRYVLP